MNVKNFRSIRDETLVFDSIIALVGANGSGKSSFLHAMELFQAIKPKITEDDFYNRNTKDNVVIQITFTELSDNAKKHFSKYIQNNELTVKRVFRQTEDKIENSYHGSTLQNPDFVDIKRCSNATKAKVEYEKLKEKEDYSKFPNWSSYNEIKTMLNDWEKTNVDKCKRIGDDEQFFGFTEVASGYLGQYIKISYIPAVRDASLDANEGKNSALTQLLDTAIRNELMQKEEVQKFQREFKEKYEKILNENNLEEILDLSGILTKILNNYVPNTEINLNWIPKNFDIQIPTASVKLIEDGYKSTVERTGHGLQRLFIMTILQYLSTTNKEDTTETSSDSSTLVLGIEEPELYQHPSRQRHLYEIFHELSKGIKSENIPKIQIVYSTHSPHFVGLDKIQQIRLLRKSVVDEGPKITEIFSTTITKLVEELNKCHGDKFTTDNIMPLLHMIKTPWINEGFFSLGVVLVEGDSDRAAILGTAKALDIKLEANGISVIPCSGKGNLDKPAIIFRELKIPTYVIWDNDRKEDDDNKSEKVKNKILLKLVNEDEEDFPSHVKSSHACIDKTLESMLKDEMGELYEDMLNNSRIEYGLDKSDAIKNPTVISTMLEDVQRAEGEIPDTLIKIIENIEKLVQE